MYGYQYYVGPSRTELRSLKQSLVWSAKTGYPPFTHFCKITIHFKLNQL